MRHETAKDLCARCLEHIMAEGTGYYVENPATLFTREARDGKYDDISDEAYAVLLDETDELAGLLAGMLVRPRL